MLKKFSAIYRTLNLLEKFFEIVKQYISVLVLIKLITLLIVSFPAILSIKIILVYISNFYLTINVKNTFK